METQELKKHGRSNPGFGPYILGLAGCWTLIVCGYWWWNLTIQKKNVINLASTAAQTHILKDVIFREWVSDHGGVYVPVTEKTPPNPYLSSLPERDISTTSGERMTLVNPAYMSRQVHELSKKQFGVQAHMTSLTPIRPENVPDDWETNALKALERGSLEFFSVESVEGKPHFRMMRPLFTKKECLKCHAFQGYKEGDIRGGLSIALPLDKFEAIVSPAIVKLTWGYLLLWALGLAWIGFMARLQGRRPAHGRGDELLHADGVSVQDNATLSGMPDDDNRRQPSTKPTIWRMFLPIFIPLVVISGIMAAIPLYFEHQSELIIHKDQQLHHVDQVNETLQMDLKGVVSDLMVLSSYSELKLLLESGGADIRSKVEKAFLAFSANKGMYDQVRLLDHQGMELVRVDYHRGMPAITHREKLQNKGKRYYFADTFVLGDGEVYVSPLDLNIELGEVEKPLKPMIRFGTPVFDSSGKKKGIILLNYLAERMLNDMVTIYDVPDAHVMLLNADGHWFKGLRPEDEWGFMFDDRKDRTFQADFSEEWEIITGYQSGQFTSEQGLFTYATIFPLVEGIKSSSGSGDAFKPSQRQLDAKEYVWKIVTFLPGEALTKHLKDVLLRWGIVYLALICSIGIICWKLAVNRRQKAEATMALEKSEARYRGVVEDQTELICRFRPDGALTFANEAFCRYVAKSRVELEECNILALIRPREETTMMERFPFLSPATPTRSYEHRMVLPNGRTSWQQWTERGVFDQQGQLVECQSVGRDTTLQKQVEEKLKKAKEQAEEATKLKDKFVSLVAHDLQSPLSVVGGFLKIVLDDTDNPLFSNHRKILERIDGSVSSLNVLIQELLEVSRLKTGKIKANPFFVDLHFITRELLHQVMPGAEKKEIKLLNEVPKHSRIYADPQLIRRVLGNLISNAVKFCDKGDTITIFIPPEEKSAIAVKDTGIGVPEQRSDTLLSYEVHTSTLGTAGEKGTGLGLPLCQDIMKTHGGILELESKHSEGSVFYAKFPFLRPLVMVVDDEPKALSALQKTLQTLGVDVLSAENGLKALETLKDKTPHLIISDVFMPEMDGFELMKNLRDNPLTDSIPVIMYTARNDMEVAEKALALGASDFLAKPFDLDELVLRVRKFIS